MNPRKLVSRLLLAFVAVALLIATADVTGLKKKFAGISPDSAGTPSIKPATSDDADHTDDARYAAIFYHAKHRCDTCVKIEEYAHTALLPAIYGVGTGIPVIVFAIALSLGAKSLGALFQNVTATEQKIRFATGVVILMIGLWLTIQNVFL